MKYRTEQKHNKHLSLALTPGGRAREFFGGAAIALPWAMLGMAVFFLPDYIGSYSESAAMSRAFWMFAASILLWVIAGVGYRRAFRFVVVDIDGRDGRLERTERAFFGSQSTSSIPTSSITSVRLDSDLGGHRAVLTLAAGDEYVVARAWFGADEILRIAELLEEVTGAKRARDEANADGADGMK